MYWLCNGVNDEVVLRITVTSFQEIRKCLENERHSLRRSLSDVVGANCPELKFVADRTALMNEVLPFSSIHSLRKWIDCLNWPITGRTTVL